MTYFIQMAMSFIGNIFTGIINEQLKTPAEEISIDSEGGDIDIVPDLDFGYLDKL